MQFHWDRYGKMDENSSCWIRVSQTWAGANYGAMHVPRIGQEVIVDFLNGDPDYPIITGRVYNALQMPPWELPANKTQSGIKTRSSIGGAGGDGMKSGAGDSNAIRFEDKKGAEQLWLHAQKDQLTEVENNEDKWVGNDRSKSVDGNETTTIGKNRTESVVQSETVTIGTTRSHTVRYVDTLLAGSKFDSIETDYLIEAGSQIRLVCGESVLELNANGQVNIKCKAFNFTADMAGEINTLQKILDLNMEGRKAATQPEGQGLESDIAAQINAQFPAANK